MRNRLVALLLPAVIAMLPSFAQAASYSAKITIGPAGCTLQSGDPVCPIPYSASAPTSLGHTNIGDLISNPANFNVSGACHLVKVNSPGLGFLTISLDSVGTCKVTASLNVWDSLANAMAVGSAQYSFQIPKTDFSFRDTSDNRATSLLAGSTISNDVITSFNDKKSQPMLNISVNTPDICGISQVKFVSPYPSILQTLYDVTGKSAGICTLTYTTPETDDFFASSNTKSFTITSNNKTIPTLTVCDTPDIVVGATGQACFSTDAPGDAELNSRDASICTVSGSTVTAVAPGVCEVTIATYPSDTLDRATAVQRINIIKGSTETSKLKQVIAFGLVPSKMSVGDSVGISVTGGDSGNPVTLSSQSTDFCTVRGTTVTAMDVGECRITANQDGNDSYNAADPALLSISIGGPKPKPSIAIGNIAPLAAGESAPVRVVGDTSGQPVVLSVLPPDTCAVTGTTLKALAAGTCTIVADKAGDNTYAPGQAKLDVRITAKRYPFAAAISAAGPIDKQTLTVSFSPSSEDAGLTGAMFVSAVLEDTAYFLGSSGWVEYNVGDEITPLMTGPLAQKDIILVSNADLTPLVGGQLFFGYGLGTDLKKAYANMYSRETFIRGYDIH